MKKTMIKLILLTATIFSNGAFAAESAIKLDKAPINVNDKASLQGGARTFMNYCLGCHSIEFQRYSRTAVDLGIDEAVMAENLIFTGSYSTRDEAFKPSKIGNQIFSSMSRTDGKYWFGATPPDLSTIVRAKGADYIYTYLRTFYADPTRPLGVNNLAFPSVGMPHALIELQGLQKPIYGEHLPVGCEKADAADCKPQKVVTGLEPMVEGRLSAQEYNRVVGDLVNFLSYVSEPAQIKRAQYGPYVLFFLLIFIVLAYLLNKEYWKKIH